MKHKILSVLIPAVTITPAAADIKIISVRESGSYSSTKFTAEGPHNNKTIEACVEKVIKYVLNKSGDKSIGGYNDLTVENVNISSPGTYLSYEASDADGNKFTGGINASKVYYTKESPRTGDVVSTGVECSGLGKDGVTWFRLVNKKGVSIYTVTYEEYYDNSGC